MQHLFHGNIPGESEKGKQGEVYLAGRNPGQIAPWEGFTSRKTAQEMGSSQQKDTKRKPLLLEKASKTGTNVGKTASLHAFNKFPTWLFY